MGETFFYDKSYYTQYDHDMEYFYELYKTYSFIPRNSEVNIFSKVYMKEVSGLFKFFYYSKNFETFQKNVVWARQYLNEYVFVTAFEMFFTHSKQYHYIVFPAVCEVLPHYFFNGKFTEAVKGYDYETYKYEEELEKKWIEWYKKVEHPTPYVKKFDWFTKKFHYIEDHVIYRDETKLSHFQKYKEFFEGTKMFWKKADYWSKYDFMNEHYKLVHLTEDFDWNMFWYYFNIYYPSNFHVEGFKYAERRGEYFMWVVQQLLARYQLERYSYGFSEIEHFSFDKVYKYGYNPQLSFYGQSYSYRPNYYKYEYFYGGDSYLSLAELMKEHHQFGILRNGRWIQILPQQA